MFQAEETGYRSNSWPYTAKVFLSHHQV